MSNSKLEKRKEKKRKRGRVTRTAAVDTNTVGKNIKSPACDATCLPAAARAIWLNSNRSPAGCRDGGTTQELDKKNQTKPKQNKKPANLFISTHHDHSRVRLLLAVTDRVCVSEVSAGAGEVIEESRGWKYSGSVPERMNEPRRSESHGAKKTTQSEPVGVPRERKRERETAGKTLSVTPRKTNKLCEQRQSTQRRRFIENTLLPFPPPNKAFYGMSSHPARRLSLAGEVPKGRGRWKDASGGGRLLWSTT